MEKADQHIVDILEILQGQPEPMNSMAIADLLQDEGNRISDRTIRHYLQQMDRIRLGGIFEIARRPRGPDALNGLNGLSKFQYASSGPPPPGPRPKLQTGYQRPTQTPGE